jgi:hypothetical protein
LDFRARSADIKPFSRFMELSEGPFDIIEYHRDLDEAVTVFIAASTF